MGDHTLDIAFPCISNVVYPMLYFRQAKETLPSIALFYLG